MVSEHNKALSPFIHLRFWECLGFGELHGADTKAPIVLEAEGRTCPFQRRGSRQEKSLLWSGYKKKISPIALSAPPGREGGTAETRHLWDRGLSRGTEGARRPQPGSGISYLLNHPETILKPPTNTNKVKHWTHVAGTSLPKLQVEAGIETSFCSPRI